MTLQPEDAEMPEFQIAALDIILVILYIAGTVAVAFLVARKSGEESEGYFLGGRNFIWPLVGLSLFASNISGTSFVGFAAAGYRDGVVAYN